MDAAPQGHAERLGDEVAWFRIGLDTGARHARAGAQDEAAGGWNFEEFPEDDPGWLELIADQAPELGIFAAFATLAMVSFLRKSVPLKYVTLVLSVALLGIYQSQLVSITNVLGSLTGNWPFYEEELALSALGLSPGARVLIPALTFVATATAVLRAGLRPVVADVDAESWLLTPRIAERALAAVRCDCVMPVTTFGCAQDAAAWDDFSERTSLPIKAIPAS